MFGAIVTREYIVIDRFTGAVSNHMVITDRGLFSFISGGQCSPTQGLF